MNHLRSSQAFFAIAFAGIPFLGVWLWGWSAREVVLLYWIENLIIGAWQVVKMLALQAHGTPLAAKVATAAFFTFHFGFFCFVHGVFVFALTQEGGIGGPDFPTPGNVMNVLSGGALFAVLSNVVMHGIDVFRNYYVSGKFRETNIGALMAEPYKHIFVIHIAILAAGFLSAGFSKGTLPLLFLIILGKLILDLRQIFSANSMKGDNNDTAKSGPNRWQRAVNRRRQK